MTSNTKGFGAVGVLVAVAVIGVLAAGAFFLGKGASVPSLQGERAGVQEFVDGIKPGEAIEINKVVSIPAGSDNFVYTNRSGRAQYVDLLALRTSGTASSTFTLVAGTSTSATAWNGFSVPSNLKSFLSATLATSSTATSTNSIQGNGAPSGSGAGVAYLAAGESLIVGLYQTYGNACTGAVCETATSTNRGFNVSGILRILTP